VNFKIKNNKVDKLMILENLNTFEKLKKKFIVAHRGSSETYVENTLEAFEDAINSGAKMIEVDVQITKDKHIVAIHNNEIIDINSNVSCKIEELTFSQLQDVYFEKSENREIDSKIYLDVKSNSLNEINSPEIIEKKSNFQKYSVPKLEEVINLVNNKAFIIIEIKSNFTEFDKQNVELIYQVVKNNDFIEQTIFASFDIELLIKLSEIDSNAKIAVIKNPYKNLLPSDYLQKIKYNVFICSIDEINEEIAKDAKTNNLSLGIYSADNLEQLQKIKHFNINAIVTNFPKKILNLIKENSIFDINDFIC